MSITLSKRLEAYKKFGEFCNRYQLHPGEVAEVIQLTTDLSRIKTWSTKKIHRNIIEKRLERMGFTRISFKVNDLTFLDKFEDEVHLPEII